MKSAVSVVIRYWKYERTHPMLELCSMYWY